MSSQRSFFNRRIHSLLGVIPVGFFLLEHFYTNYKANESAQSFIDGVEWLWGIPFLLVLEIFFIFLPLMYHGIYGLYIAFQAKPNTNQFGTFRNYMFVLQRITGVITLIFVVWHVWDTRIRVVGLSEHSLDVAKNMAIEQALRLQSPVFLTIFIIGIIAAVFHFCNGMWSFLVSWGITVGPRAQKVSTYVWMVAFVLISFVGIKAALAFNDPSFIDEVQKITAAQH
ncbi:succinate dehydrogenase cytochrome b558 subunit [Thermoflavimicrobium daqui]|uniref:Succinate dehydrogenase n=1 Tax=Thermoflavimicrobium daqui TaxID=2137476 RepID=A0A364K8Z6_9BACL|nr:succinate dehydrogenase cytochrome b558 subunit [Thermoflavimicrobium daqui]RAL26767.1 succinate dehydrogenase [Thermoflavimicrobium daqui]